MENNIIGMLLWSWKGVKHMIYKMEKKSTILLLISCCLTNNAAISAGIKTKPF